MKIIIIAAVAKNNVIGNNGKIPWYSNEDLQYFKSVTTPHPVVMGRKTYQSLTKPLNNRTNIILTGNKLKVKNENILTFSSINSLMEFCSSKGFEKIFIIGGGEIYNQFIDIADELIISHFNIDVVGDTYFPKIKKGCWQERITKEYEQFKIFHYEKVV